MPKNILIFSDGTGQSGGREFDEDRSNIYKLYRATRCGPDTSNDPSEQLCFYDPGLGSPADGGGLFGEFPRRIYNWISQATGLGITKNVVDCYAAIIRLYRDGDRIFLFGFSRGAYTVRCLSAVLAYCGVPRSLPNGSPLPMDLAGSKQLAERAVKDVYQFCSSWPETSTSYVKFMLETRRRIAKRFRSEYGSSVITGQTEKPNTVPYFIGVFDTVATLAQPGLLIVFSFAAALLFATTIWFAGFLTKVSPEIFDWIGWGTPAWWPDPASSRLVTAVVMLIFGAAAWLENYLKYDFRVPGYGMWQSLKTVHFAKLKHRFYDTSLCGDVVYAKHAISIDENRKDFARVPWTPAASHNQSSAKPPRDTDGNIYFEQVWFSGVHSDVGGGYSENESRLSDITLKWMLAAASIVPNGVKHDKTLLRLFPDASGPQHDEQKSSRLWKKMNRPVTTTKAILHRTVYERFAAASGVVQYDRVAPYRPVNLSDQDDLKPYYTGIGEPTDVNMSDNIEDRWEKKKAGES